jgi:magnesium chelatase family protein
VSLACLACRDTGERSVAIRERVEHARQRQRQRYGTDTACNALAPGRWLDAHGGIDAAARTLLASAAERLHLSARAFHRVLRVARTIADLEASPGVQSSHVAEAIGYRPRSVENAAVAAADVA